MRPLGVVEAEGQKGNAAAGPLRKQRRRNTIRQCSCKIVPCNRSTNPLVHAWRGLVRVSRTPSSREACRTSRWTRGVETEGASSSSRAIGLPPRFLLRFLRTMAGGPSPSSPTLATHDCKHCCKTGYRDSVEIGFEYCGRPSAFLVEVALLTRHLEDCVPQHVYRIRARSTGSGVSGVPSSRPAPRGAASFRETRPGYGVDLSTHPQAPREPARCGTALSTGRKASWRGFGRPRHSEAGEQGRQSHAYPKQ